MSEKCKDCPYQVGNTRRLDAIDGKVDKLDYRVISIEKLTSVQESNMQHTNILLDDLKCGILRLEKVLIDKEDPFKKAMFEVGMWVIKASVVAGGLIWLRDNIVVGML